MSRFAKHQRVFFFEEPIREGGAPRLEKRVCAVTGVHVITPVLPHEFTRAQELASQRGFLQELVREEHLKNYIAWYYTPMAMEFTSALDPVLTVYDCMDELTAFAGAPEAMKTNEVALFKQADLVFTGGASLYAVKRGQHSSVYQFSSSVDTEHFRKARQLNEPADQALLPGPRIGYAGVIDERMDLELLAEVARRRPTWQIVLLGPIAKINPDSLPKLPNVHLLGMKQYDDLPAYFSGWDIGMLPFALNDATKYISPTKTPEYLAAGLRVISTPIRDVVSPYGELGLVAIANGPEQFIAAAEAILQSSADAAFLTAVDQFLARSSWDRTWSEMERLMRQAISQKSDLADRSPNFVSGPAFLAAEEVL